MGHADPVHRQDHAVDAQTSFVADDLLRDLVGRAQQEAIAGEFVEGEREVVVALRHRLVLAPLAGDLVLLLQVRARQSARLWPRARDYDPAPDGPAAGDRL